ncbi:phosphomannomutase [Tanticharoenia sakaeratensis NBRC 103193]|uniref:Phosphomannomutase n=2 Tax=Tanticharoenia TaxID=444052 RepID=A0A0D6MM92_9PROT|nr:phosphomannomutase [Tanticharoenia sakaeratensis NBRC 103193]GBQ21551.1 phosphoglucosamine mutase [Tanticharoenia sakaeratensis NBRC 103193]
MRIDQWMERSGVAFGTSGARGLVAAMTDEVCFAYTTGFLSYLESCGDTAPGASVALAGDLRPSTPRILRACVAAIRHRGYVPVFCGYVPTPALCVHAFAAGMPSLMVTGSHIPADRNGIKFNRPQGEFLKTDEAGMRAQDVEVPADLFDENGALQSPADLPDPVDVTTGFIRRYQDFFGTDALKGLRLGIYQHSAVGRDVLVDLVQALGATATPFGRSTDFVPVDTEAVRPDDIALARERAAQGDLDAILTTDGDSDRPLLADRKGHWLRGDVLGILAARFLQAQSVATPVSSNTALEKAGFAADIRRTKIGSPFVVAAMADAVQKGAQPVVGYEANGGFLLATKVENAGRHLSALPTRDSVLPMIAALVAARAFGNDLAALTATLPERFTGSDRIVGMPTAQSAALLDRMRQDPGTAASSLGLISECGAVTGVDETDGLRMSFASDDIVHFRPSGNAPEMRIYVETDTSERTDALLALARAALIRESGMHTHA